MMAKTFHSSPAQRRSACASPMQLTGYEARNTQINRGSLRASVDWVLGVIQAGPYGIDARAQATRTAASDGADRVRAMARDSGSELLSQKQRVVLTAGRWHLPDSRIFGINGRSPRLHICETRCWSSYSHAADRAVDERTLLPGPAGDPKVVPSGIDDPEVRQAPRAILEILFKWPPSRHDQIALTGNIVNLEHELRPGRRQPRRESVRNGPSRCSHSYGAALHRYIRARVTPLILRHAEAQYPRVKVDGRIKVGRKDLTPQCHLHLRIVAQAAYPLLPPAGRALGCRVSVECCCAAFGSPSWR